MSVWFDTDAGKPATHDGTLPDNWFGGDPIGGILDPLSMISGLPSFSANGGDAAPSMARSDSTGIMSAPFIINGKSDVADVATSILPWAIGGLALWLSLKK